ncbi:unnamed protein product [Ascophyllum nodosum]
MMPGYARSVLFVLLVLVRLESGLVRTTPPPVNMPDIDDDDDRATIYFKGFGATSLPREDNVVLLTQSVTRDVEGEILQPKGKHYSWYSFQPFFEGLTWAKSSGSYFKEMIAQFKDEPVFKIHPGLAVIALTDHTSGKWFFDQPDTVLDRQDGAYFGAVRCSREYLGNSLPALVTNLKEAHPVVREYMFTIVRERLDSAPTALSHAADAFYNDKRLNGWGKLVEVCPADYLLGLVTEGPRRRRSREDGPHRCRGCVGG